MDSFKRKDPQDVATLLRLFIKDNGLTLSYNNRRVFAAWNELSGASAFTAGRFFRDGVLYITLTSSVARTELSFRKEELIRAINDRLVNDPLFIKDVPGVRLVHELILK